MKVKLVMNHERQYIKHKFNGYYYYINKVAWADIPDELVEVFKNEQPKSFVYDNQVQVQTQNVEVVPSGDNYDAMSRMDLLRLAKNSKLKPNLTHTKQELINMIKTAKATTQ